MHTTTDLVLNWHLTEACNYKCQYCYASWEDANSPRDLIHDQGDTTALLKELYQFFRPGNASNPLAQRLTWRSLRLNLAGGEPSLYARKLPFLVGTAHRLGFEISLISNGSHLSDELLHELAPQLSWLGISIDSAIPETNRAIGRLDRRGRLLSWEGLAGSIEKARQLNPNLQIKLNTVVNQINHGENLGALVECLTPDKWKVLRMLPVVNQHLAVSDAQFAAFVARHRPYASLICAEDNADMRESYLMVDPHGRFFQNSPVGAGQGYAYSRPILQVGAQAAFAEMTFDHERFCARYPTANMGASA